MLIGVRHAPEEIGKRRKDTRTVGLEVIEGVERLTQRRELLLSRRVYSQPCANGLQGHRPILVDRRCGTPQLASTPSCSGRELGLLYERQRLGGAMGRIGIRIVLTALVLAIYAAPAAAQVSVAVGVGTPHVGARVVVGAPVYGVYPYYPPYPPYAAPYPYYSPYYYYPYAGPYGRVYYRAYPGYYGGAAPYYYRGAAPYSYRGGRPYYRGGPTYNGRGSGYYGRGPAGRGNGGGARYAHSRR